MSGHEIGLIQRNAIMQEPHVLGVSKVLTAPFFSNPHNFETKRDTSEKHGIKLLHLQEIYPFDLSFSVVPRSVSKLQRFEKFGAINTLRLLPFKNEF